ncbi:RNA polymerase sigma factor [Telmatospirillum siberiense]|uniref:RNA polymerase subunit sigma-70 n=1 Tax=Telmatospirillum siberiense TaxID=382514 RepID=A0A2N3PW59_9PROT|nr:sigma-70 family RNA polymerase sigma factor [Telmatospirillum siberiense]PKU24630.1 RNA polymerase subunit sigma-70 [Telmatospirillum siberiense]
MTETPWTMLQRRLVSRYDDLRRRLARHLGSPERADDALQDTWLRLERGGEISSVQSPDSYLFRVAVNIARDQLRAESRRLTTTEVEVLLNIADTAPDATRILEARSDLEALKRVMEELPARQRAILVAARLEKMPRSDIARRFGVSVRFVQRELQEAQDYCAARLRNLEIPRYRSMPRETSLVKEPLEVIGQERTPPGTDE